MTPDELVCELFNRQGYVVIQTIFQREIGDVHGDVASSVIGTCAIPIRIVGLSDKEEFRRQCDLAAEIIGDDSANNGRTLQHAHYYRVEDMD